MEKKLLLQNLSIPEFEYKLPAQRDGFNCGVFVSLYMLVIARGLTEYEISGPIDNF